MFKVETKVDLALYIHVKNKNRQFHGLWKWSEIRNHLCTTHRRWEQLTLRWRVDSWTGNLAELCWQRSHSRWTGTSPHADGQCWHAAGNASSPSGTGLVAEREKEIECVVKELREMEQRVAVGGIFRINFTEITTFLWICKYLVAIWNRTQCVNRGEEEVGLTNMVKENEQQWCEGQMRSNWEKQKASSAAVKWLWQWFLKQTSTWITSLPLRSLCR